MRSTPPARGALGHLLRDEEGSVTAEFAIALPVLLAIFGLVITGILLSTHRVTLTSAAAEIARYEARGDRRLAAERLQLLESEVSVVRFEQEGLKCVELRSHPVGGLLSNVQLTAKGCAAPIEQSP